MMKSFFRRGVTLIELLVVVLIISILSTIAVGVYGSQVTRANFSKARAEIRLLEMAATAYMIDVGQLPPSGSGLLSAPGGLFTTEVFEGSGGLALALRSSLSGSPSAPSSLRWNGPYVQWDYNRLGDRDGNPITSPAGANTALGRISFLDPWGNPYVFVRSSDYFFGGTQLPPTNPLFATETFYNPGTMQIISFGPNGTSLGVPQRGLEVDDITNFLGPER